MALDPVPTWIHGAKHSGDILRQGTFNETGGSEGVSSPTAFRVRATQTPSNKVRVDPGGLLMLSPWDEGQTYSMRNASETLVEVPASSSLSANTWYINAWINDPNKPGGTVPVSKEFGPYNFLTCDPEPKDNNPAYACAQIDVPKNEATIPQDYIMDLREIANPRVKPVPRFKAMVQGEEEILVTDDVQKGEYFPNNGGPQSIDIPEWATRALIDVDWVQTRFAAGNAWGQVWVEYGPYAGPSLRERSTQRMQWDTGGSTNVSRGAMKVVDDVYIPASYRGTTQLFVPKATRAGGANNTVSMDAMSAMSMKVWFQEVADRSTT